MWQMEEQRRSQKKAMRFQRQMAEENRLLAEKQAEDLRQAGHKAESEARSKAKRLAASQQASLAGSGLALGEGTSAQLLQDTMHRGHVDAITARENYERERHAALVSAKQYSLQKQMIGAQKFDSLGTIATGLSGLGQMAGFGYQWSKTDDSFFWNSPGKK